MKPPAETRRSSSSMPAVETGDSLLTEAGWIHCCHAARTTTLPGLNTTPTRGFTLVSLEFASVRCENADCVPSLKMIIDAWKSSTFWLNCCQNRSPCSESAGETSLVYET